MNEHSGTTVSVWMKTADLPTPTRLVGDAEADVCIVGAGISGLSAAYQLTGAGKSVLVIDDGPLGAGETERTTAHLSNAMDDRYYYLERQHGLENARRICESHTQAIDEIERIARTEGIDCDFERLDGYLFVPPGGPLEDLDEELRAAQRAGVPGIERVPHGPAGWFETGPCLRFPNQGQFHPWKYLRGLIGAIEARGGKIFPNTRAVRIRGGERATVETEDAGVIRCGSVIVATNAPVNDRVTMHTKQAPYRTYAVGLRVPAGSLSHALVWDTAEDAALAQKEDVSTPYHYLRLQRAETPGGPEVLIVGGEDHKTGQARDMDARWTALERWTRERFPQAEGLEFRWSGQVIEPADGVAYIGRNPGDEANVYIVTGDSRQGMTHGTIAGMLLRDLILGRANPWATVYDPARKPANKEFARENLNVMLEYKDYITSGEAGSEEAIAPGSGAVLRHGLKKVAVYRDRELNLHQRSAVCPHLGCIVHWNPGEHSWDCPCHGSRFNALGVPINGPAITGLSQA